MNENPLADEGTFKLLTGEYELTDPQAQFCLLVVGGTKPIEAVQMAYNYAAESNAYNQLATLLKNPKVDRALKGLGFNLRDTQEKQAFSIIRSWYEIAFDEGTPIQHKLTALDKLAKYNPVLLQWQQEDVTENEMDKLRKQADAMLAELHGREELPPEPNENGEKSSVADATSEEPGDE